MSHQRVKLRTAAADSCVSLEVSPHLAHGDPDIQTLQRVCNVHDVPLATNLATAELIVQPKTIDATVRATHRRSPARRPSPG